MNPIPSNNNNNIENDNIYLGISSTSSRTFSGHTDSINSIIYFPFPYDLLISCSFDETIRIWNCSKIFSNEEEEEENIIKDHSYNFLLKWNSFFFCSCSKDKFIFCFSIEEYPKIKIIKYVRMKNSVEKLLKINEDRILVLTDCLGVGGLWVLDFNSFKIIMKLKTEIYFPSFSGFLNSLNFSDCFYIIDNENENNNIKLMNLSNNEEKIEKEVKNIQIILTFSIFTKKKKSEEILVFVDFTSFLYFYNLGNSIEEKKVPEFITKIELESKLPLCSSFFNFFQNYLILGDIEGDVSIFSLKQLKEIGKYKIHSDEINDLKIISGEEEEDNKFNMKLVTCSSDQKIKMSSFIHVISVKKKKNLAKKLNEKCKNLVQRKYYNRYAGKEVTGEELKRIMKKEIIEKCISKEYLKIIEDLGIAKSYEYDFDSLQHQLFYFQNDIFSFGDFSFQEIYDENKNKNKLIRNGFGCEFLKISEQSYKLFFVGDFKDNKRKKGSIILNKNKKISGNFRKGKIDLFSVKEFRMEYRKIRDDFFPEKRISELFQKKWTKEELKIKSIIFLSNLNEKWIHFLNNFMKMTFEDNNKIEIEQSNLKFVECEEDDSFLYFGLTNTDGIIHGFGIEFIGKKPLLRITKNYTPVYVGEFVDGKREGYGKNFDENSRRKVFEGEFRDGLADGRGIEYEFDKKNGRNFVIFEGQFQNGLRNGMGKFYELKEEKYILVHGVWKNGRLKKKLKQYKCPFISYNNIKRHLTQDNKIGFGANGDIFKVKKSVIRLKGLDSNIKGEYLAVKVMKKSSGLEREMMFRMMKRGIELCYDIKNNENILETYGIFHSSQGVGCIMKFCKDSVDQVIEKGKGTMKIEEKMHYLLGVAKGMMNLHEINTMHRDLKWGNVLITAENEVKITDFDTLREDERDYILNISTLTARVGTPGYSAPEIHLGKKYGLPVDVFSFGIMIYSLLFELNQPYSSQFHCNCGEELLRILDPRDITIHHHVAKCNFRPLLDTEKISKYPRYLIDLMILCWDKDPAKRPTFKVIYHILMSEMKKKEIKSYYLIEFLFPKHKEYLNKDKLLLLQKDEETFFNQIIFYLTTEKYQGCRIRNLDCKQGGIYNNDDILNLLKREDNPVIEVEFSEFIKTEVEVEMSENEILLEKRISELEFKEGLFQKFLELKGLSFDEFSNFCSVEIEKDEEMEGEDFNEET